MKTRDRYQNGSIRREARKHGAAVWTLRWRETDAQGHSIRRKEIIGTVEEYPTKASAQKACAFLRSTINRETRTPHTIAELVTHYTEKELPTKTPYTQEVYEGYIFQLDHSEVGKLLTVRRSDCGS
jgi:integrase